MKYQYSRKVTGAHHAASSCVLHVQFGICKQQVTKPLIGRAKGLSEIAMLIQSSWQGIYHHPQCSQIQKEGGQSLSFVIR